MSVPTRRILDPIFGRPKLEAGGVGQASWTKSLSVGTQRVAWAAQLDAGIQSLWNDYAKVIVSVSELPFTDLKSVRLESYYTVDEVGADMAVCVYLHDPNDFDQHIELSHTPLSNVGKGYRELNYPTDIPGSSWFWFGNVTDTPDNCPTQDTLYTWAQFQADRVFRTWTIYRITFDYGYQTGDIVLNGGYLCQAQINGVTIPLEPDTKKFYKTVNVQKTLDADGAYSAGDVMSEDPTNGQGTDWDFDFGGVGKIVKAIAVSATTGLTAAITLYLYSAPPTCELDDHAANTGPVVDDLPNYIGHIDLPALASQGVGSSYTAAIAFESDVKLPLAFDKPKLYVVAVDGTGQDFGDDTTLDITLTAEIET